MNEFGRKRPFVFSSPSLPVSSVSPVSQSPTHSHTPSMPTVRQLLQYKPKGKQIVALTAWDFAIAEILDAKLA